MIQQPFAARASVVRGIDQGLRSAFDFDRVAPGLVFVSLTRVGSGSVFRARVGADSEDFTVDDAALLAADEGGHLLDLFEEMLGVAKHRFRASWGRPAQEWPDSLGPMFDTFDTFDGSGLPAMFPDQDGAS